MTLQPPIEPTTVRDKIGSFGRLMKRAEIATSLISLGIALWKLTRLEPAAAGTAVIFAAFPIIAAGIVLFGRSSLARLVSTLYLVTLSIGVGIADVSWLPGFTALHNGSTEFADRFNSLDLASRRLLTWNVALGITYMFYGLGHLVFFTDLRRHRVGLPAQLSLPTCYFGLAASWGIAILTIVLSLVGLTSACLSSGTR